MYGFPYVNLLHGSPTVNLVTCKSYRVDSFLINNLITSAQTGKSGFAPTAFVDHRGLERSVRSRDGR